MGKPVTIMLEHELGVEGAKARVEERFDALKKSIAGNIALKFEEEWVGDQLRFTAKGLGQRVNGEIDIFPQHIRIVVVLPLLLAGMAEALTKRVERDGQLMLEKK